MPQFVYDIYNVVFIVTLVLFAIGLPFLLISQGESAKMVGYSLTISFIEVCAVGLTYFMARGAAYLSLNSREWVAIAVLLSLAMVVGNAALIIFIRNSGNGNSFKTATPKSQKPFGSGLFGSGNKNPQPQPQYPFNPYESAGFSSSFSSANQPQYANPQYSNPFGAGATNPYQQQGFQNYPQF